MSKVRNPEEKKLLGLQNDNRNVYGENDKASRKGIPRSKQLSHKVARAAVSEVLATQKGPSDALALDTAEALVKARTIQSKRTGFKKTKDAPLINVLVNKTAEQPVWRAPRTRRSLIEVIRLRREIQNESIRGSD